MNSECGIPHAEDGGPKGIRRRAVSKHEATPPAKRGIEVRLPKTLSEEDWLELIGE